ncbi:MAG: ABC transporter ATP-binding protein/permease [Candidatus Omnitrophica bacterium]|nr:ABC transporter ATP-binding protein/permease [Candidatus Omnitrophota bacterium]
MKDYLRFLRFLKPHIWIMAIAIICMFGSSSMGGVSLGVIIPIVDNILSGKAISLPGVENPPVFLVNLVDRINSIPKVALLNWLIFIIALIFLIKEIFLFFQTYFMARLGQSILRDARLAIYKKLLSLSHDFYSSIQIGELVSRVTYDVGVIVNSVTEGLTDLLFQPIQLLVYLSMVIWIKVYFSISWPLTLVTILVFPLVAFPVVQIGKKLRKISTATQESMADINSQLYETIYGIDIVKTFCAEDYKIGKFKIHNNKYYKMLIKSVKRMAVISPLGEFVGVACMAIVLWFGGKEVLSGSLSAGAFIAFLAALLSLIKPFKRLSRLYGINQQALAAITRVFSVLDREPKVQDTPGATRLSQFNDSIEVKSVNFSYDKGTPVLNDINVRLVKGKILAIVGLSGAGKSTLVGLLPRFYDPMDGEVLIDGKTIKDFTINSLREHIGIVTQETILFNDSVRNNIAFGKPDANIGDIIKAAKAANSHDFIEKMPKGYDTFIGDRGMRISGGEKQRLAIARALFKDPPILILDEATSQLDTESERLVQEAIDRLMAHRTAFVIAHRLSTVEHADNIVVLDKGRVVESGTHAELLARSGVYKRLYELQFASLR